jgi:indole-3-acetate monooxygenase
VKGALLAYPADLNGWLDRVATAGPIVEAEAPASDKIRRLTDGAMAAVHGQGLMRMLLPRAGGGAQVTLPDFFAIIEAIARYDGSTAWCVCQGNGCTMLGAYLPPSVVETIWQDPRGVLAWGPGKAESVVVDGGYEVTADISFVSGSRHATWLAAHTSEVKETDGAVRLGANGKPEIRSMIFPASEIDLIDNWDVLGLRGTGSNAFRIERKFVPDEFTIVRATMIENTPDVAPLYRFPQMGIYALGFAAVALGIARGFLDAFVTLAQEKKPRLVAHPLKDNPVVQDEFARCDARINGARAFLIAEIEKGWREALAESLTIEQRMRIRLASTHATHEAKAAVDALYDTAGTSSVFASSPFERRFRDIHTVAQQIQGRKTHYQSVGSYLLGHPPDMAVI